MRGVRRLIALPLGLPVAIIAWLLMEIAGLTHPLFFPDLTKVVVSLGRQLSDFPLWHDVGATTSRAIIGLALSCLIGLPLGLFLGRHFALYRHAALPIDFIRSIPAATLFPLFILVFGIGDASKIAVVCYGCTFIILVAGIYGARSVLPSDARVAALRSLRARPIHIYRFVILPVALGSILSGLRIATSVAFVLVVITEMFLGSNDGLGKRIYDTYLAYKIPDMYATLMILGCLGYAANLSVERLEQTYRRRIGESLG